MFSPYNSIMKAHNYLSLNLYSLIGYSSIFLPLYLYCEIFLWKHNIHFSNFMFNLTLDGALGVHLFLHILAILCLMFYFIEYHRYKLGKAVKTIKWNNPIIIIFFNLGFMITTFDIIFYIIFYLCIYFST